MHLIIDGYKACPHKLADIATIYRFLDNLPALIGMEKIGPPQLAVFDDPDKAGITGIVMIVTSHISVHTYSLKGCIFMDVFSCKELDPQIVIGHTIAVFGITEYESRVLSRGTQFPVLNTH